MLNFKSVHKPHPSMSHTLSAPTALTVRKLSVDLSQGFARHWNGGDAFLTAF